MAWVVGYPIQKDQEIDLMYEAESARIWEELNAPDPCEKELKESAVCLCSAASLIDKAEEEISAAVSILWDTPMQKGMDELLERLMDFRYEIQDIAKQYGRGER